MSHVMGLCNSPTVSFDVWAMTTMSTGLNETIPLLLHIRQDHELCQLSELGVKTLLLKRVFRSL